MSTNYYDADHPSRWDDHDPQWHIGKSYLHRDGPAFIWAMETGRLEGITRIEVETGEVITRDEFTAIVQACSHHDFDSVGVQFS